MKINELTTIDQLACFLDGSQVCTNEVLSHKGERYKWIQKTLIQFRYMTLSKPDKGVVIAYLIKISGYSRQQLTRLIKQYVKTGKLVRRQQTERGFARRYTDSDIRLLADLDILYETPCGAVIKKFCERAFACGEIKFERLASISVSHLYNLRRSSAHYRKPSHLYL